MTIHSARIEIAPDKTLSVAWTDAGGKWEKLVLDDFDLPYPDEVMFGFTAGTGAASSNQEIRNLVVTQSDASSYTWDGGDAGSSNWGQADNWVNGLPVFGGQADLVFTAPAADRLVNFLGDNRTIRSLEFSGATAGDITLRTTTTADGTVWTNLRFEAVGDSSSIFVREASANNITIGGGAGGSVTFNSNMLIAHNGTGLLTIDQTIGGAGGIRKTGNGTLALRTTNTFLGTVSLMDGTIRTETNNALGATSPTGHLEIYGGTLDLNETSQSRRAIYQHGGKVMDGTITIGDRYYYYDGVFDNVVLTGSGGLDKSNPISGINTTLTLTNANNYSGTTMVRQGVLNVSNTTGSGTGTSIVRVDSNLIGSHEGGTGNISGNTTINGRHSVGNGTAGSTGLHRFGSALTYGDKSIFEWDINTAAETYDRVAVGGNLTVNNGAIFSIVSSSGFGTSFWEQSRTWSDIFGGKDISGFNPANFQFKDDGKTWTSTELASYGTFSISGGNLIWSAIPEPSTLMVGGLLAAGLMRRRRPVPMRR